MNPSLHARTLRIRSRTRELRKAIEAMDYLAFGTLHSRTKTCGKPNCRCRKDPKARHGPYYEWTRLKDGRLVHSNVSPEQATLLERAIANYRKVQELIRQWRDVSEADILETAQIEDPNSREKP
jgi:hypothetical protein